MLYNKRQLLPKQEFICITSIKSRTNNVKNSQRISIFDPYLLALIEKSVMRQQKILLDFVSSNSYKLPLQLRRTKCSIESLHISIAPGPMSASSCNFQLKCLH